MDIKAIIEKHVEPITKRHNTSWASILLDLSSKPNVYRRSTMDVLREIYLHSVLTHPKVLTQLYEITFPSYDYTMNGQKRKRAKRQKAK